MSYSRFSASRPLAQALTLGLGAALSSAAAAPLSVTLSLTDGDRPFAYHNPLKVGDQELQVQELKFYVSEVALVRSDGSEVPLPGIRLATFKKGTPPQNIEIFRADAPPGDYRGLRLNIGVPRALNHQDAALAAAPLNIEQGMYWAWNSGYIFFSLHGEAAGQNVATHIGGDNHRLTVDLSDLQKPGTALKVTDAGLSVPATLDLQKLYAAGVGGAPWDFSKPAYQQVHFGPVAAQLFLNASGAFRRADGAFANPVYRGAAPVTGSASAAPAQGASQPQTQHHQHGAPAQRP